MSRNTMRNLARFSGRKSELSPMRIKMFAIIVVFITIAVLGYSIYEQSMGAQNPQLKGILSRVNRFGVLIDPANEIGVNSLADVGYRETSKNLEIIYGKVTIRLPKNKIDDNTIAQLGRIGITLEQDKKGKYIVYYRKAEVAVHD